MGSTIMFFIIEEGKETILDFSQVTVKVLENMLQNNLIFINIKWYNSLNVKLSNSQLNKLDSTMKNETVVLTLSKSKMIGNSDDKTNFPQKVLLTNRQEVNLQRAFANNSSFNIKLSKSQLSRMIQ